MQRLYGPVQDRVVELAVLEQERSVGAGPDWRPAGTAPFLVPGRAGPVALRPQHRPDAGRCATTSVVSWLGWPPTQSSSRGVPRTGGSTREVPLAERFAVEQVPVVESWRGGGVLRIAPTGRPWSVWLFWEDDGSFAGHYVNLELPHSRRGGETATRDLTLDLWLEPDGELWLKDADEVEVAVSSGRYAESVAGEIHAAAQLGACRAG